MEYQVPQFIEVEDKIIGPFTLKQFIYVAGTIGLCVVFFAYLPFLFAALLSLPVIGFGAALAFYKVNNKPFIQVVEAAFNYFTRRKLLIWKNTHTPSGERTAEGPAPTPQPQTPTQQPSRRLTRGKLNELAWSLDVKSDTNEPLSSQSE